MYFASECQASLSITSSRSNNYSNSCPSHRWCHPTISSSVVPFSSCLQSFPASSGDQSIGPSASASVLPMNSQDWFPLGWTSWISLLSKGLSRVFSNTSLKASTFWHSAFFLVQLSHSYMTTGKTIALTIWAFVSKVMSLLFNIVVGICNHIKEYYIYYLFCFSGEP